MHFSSKRPRAAESREAEAADLSQERCPPPQVEKKSQVAAGSGNSTSKAQRAPAVVNVVAVVAKSKVVEKAEANEKALASVASQSKKSALWQKIVVPNPYPSGKIPGRVLQEEDYAEAVSALIERDFYPDLPLLRASHALFKAEEAGDDRLADALAKQLGELPRATPMSLATATPMSLATATPMSLSAATPPPPAETPPPSRTDFPPTPQTPRDQAAPSAAARRLRAWEREDGAESVISEPLEPSSQTLLRLASGEDVAVDLANVRLDDFQRVFTSEDNASFEEIWAKDKEKRRQKEWWAEHAELKHNTDVQQHALALQDEISERPNTLMTNKFKARNYRCFNPPGLPQVPIEKPLVEFKNTRFTTKQQLSADTTLVAAIASRKARMEGEQVTEVFDRMAKEGLFGVGSCGVDSVRCVGGQIEMNGHAFPMVSTPNLMPGANGMSPLMTYGQIASTPKLLDDEATGPKFQIQQESARDKAADKLARGAMQKQRESKQNSKKDRLKALGLTPSSITPGKTPGKTPQGHRLVSPGSVSSKVSPGSPIGQLIQRAQRMAQRGGRLKIGSGGLATPTTPGTDPPAKRARQEKPARSAPSGLPASMMENLL